MSNRLAVSSALSVLMMAIYVLFCADVPRVPLGPTNGAGNRASATELPSASLPAPQLPALDRVLPLTR